MTSKLSGIINFLANKPKTQLSYYGFSEKSNKRSIHKILNIHFSNFKVNNTLYLLWNSFPKEKSKYISGEMNLVPEESNRQIARNSKSFQEEKRKKISENTLIIEDPFKQNYFPKNIKIETNNNEKKIEKPKDNSFKSIQECIVSTLFPNYEISLNREGFIKSFRNFLALKGNEIFPNYKFISKIIKKLEFGEELIQSKTIFKTEWFSVVSLIFYINIIYFKDYQNYANFITYLPIDKHKRTLIIYDINDNGTKGVKGEIKEEIDDLLEKINPNYSKNEVEKMKLDEIQKYAKFLGFSIYKEGKVGYVNKTKEELTNEIFPNETVNEIINEV
jgi:hypothetical protein